MRETAQTWEERFDELFCEQDRGLRTGMKAKNNISMADGIKAFIRAELENIRRVLAPDKEGDMSNSFEPDWDQLEACRESLREHMAMLNQYRAALEILLEATEQTVDTHGCGVDMLRAMNTARIALRMSARSLSEARR